LKSKYVTLYCPNCMTEMHITRQHMNEIVKCLCGKNYMVISMNGKYKLAELTRDKMVEV